MAMAEVSEFASIPFAQDGIRQDIPIADWKGGWASIVGGLNGKPTAQQFNMVFYIVSSLLIQAGSNITDIQRSIKSLVPKEDFTANKIISLLSSAALMTGCNADLLDGKHASDFAAATHAHSASQITSGSLPVARGGTGADTALGACQALGAMRTAGGTFSGIVYFANGSAYFVNASGDAVLKSVTATDDVRARRVYDAVYNDYAEFVPRGEQTEPGDIVALDMSAQAESYIKATPDSVSIGGVHTGEYAMLIGGEPAEPGEDFVQKNLPKHIPVALAGRVHAKVLGPVKPGDRIVLSDIPGVGRAAEGIVDPRKVVGYAVEASRDPGISMVKIRVGVI